MSEDSQRTYTAREIVLEFFPATHERLIPRADAFRLERQGDGSLIVSEVGSERQITLTPVTPAGNPTNHVCCDLCQRSAPRLYLQMFRVALPDSGGRRFRYVSVCSDVVGCAARRMGDEALRALMDKVFES